MRKTSWFRYLGVICVTVFFAAACGGSGGSGGNGSSGTQHIALGVTSFNSLHLPLIMARDENLMKPYGIQLDINTFQNTGQIIPALLSGSLQIGTATPEQLFAAQNKQPSLKMIASEDGTNPYSLIVDPKIKSIQDMRGKTLGVTGTGASADYFTAKLMLLAQGFTENRDYHFINAGPPPQRAAALVNGQVDAVMSFPPDSQKMLDKGMKSIAQASSLPNLHKVIIATYIANKPWYTKNHALAVKFMRGYLASVRWLYDPANKSKAIGHIAKDMKVSTKYATITYDTFVTKLKAYPKNGLIDPTALTTTAKNAHATGVKGAPDLDTLSSRYDNSLAKAAAQQG